MTPFENNKLRDTIKTFRNWSVLGNAELEGNSPMVSPNISSPLSLQFFSFLSVMFCNLDVLNYILINKQVILITDSKVW